jgi:hypothetical protein
MACRAHEGDIRDIPPAQCQVNVELEGLRGSEKFLH